MNVLRARPPTGDRVRELLSLCSLQPRHTVEQSIAAVQFLGADEAADILGRQRCRSLVVSRLTPYRNHAAVERVLSLLEPRAARIRHMHAVLEDNLARVGALAAKHGVTVLAFKGLGARKVYAEPHFRDFGDLDLYVADRTQAALLARALREEDGYTVNPGEVPWLKYDARARLLYGQINLLAPAATDDLINVDVHFGDYSVRHSSRLGLDRSLSFPDSAGLHTMDIEHSLASGVNNAAGDHFVTVKDTNDLLCALSLERVDWALFRGLLESAGLTHFFGFVVEKLRACSILTPRQEEVLTAAGVPTSGLEPAPRLDRPDWGRRCWATTVHAFSAARPRGLGPAVCTAVDAYRYYREPLRLTVDTNPGAAEPLERFDMATCVRLVPLDLARELPGGRHLDRPGPHVLRRTALRTDRGVVRRDTEAGTFIDMDGEPFVATVSYRIPGAMLGGTRDARRDD